MNQTFIDSAQIFKTRWQRQVYRPFQALLESILGISRINQLYRRVGGRSLDAIQFCQAALVDLGVDWTIDPRSLAMLQKVQGPCVVMANHPLGGREALVLHCVLGQARPDYRILSNYILGHVPETRSKLILVDPFETPAAIVTNRQPLREVLRYLKAGGLLGVFPAGEVSYWQAGEKRIADKPWSEQTLRLALRTGATIVPLHFSGYNSFIFNAVARLNPVWKSFLLIHQLAFGPTLKIQVSVGQPIAYTQLTKHHDPNQLASYLRDKVYALAPQP